MSTKIVSPEEMAKALVGGGDNPSTTQISLRSIIAQALAARDAHIATRCTTLAGEAATGGGPMLPGDAEEAFESGRKLGRAAAFSQLCAELDRATMKGG